MSYVYVVINRHSAFIYGVYLCQAKANAQAEMQNNFLGVDGKADVVVSCEPVLD